VVRRSALSLSISGILLLAPVVFLAVSPAADRLAPVTIDYPANESIFPPDFAAPTFLFRDAADTAALWRIEVTFAGGSPSLRVESRAPHMQVGEIDPRCVVPTNKLPELTPEQAAARTWKPDAAVWAAIKAHSVSAEATVTITGFRDGAPGQPVSRGQVNIRTSKDPVDAPIFYRDVPLAPSEVQRGVIKPLSAGMVPLIAWRLRNVSQTSSKVVLEGMPNCANCHSFSRDGTTLGMDLDGPQTNKGLYFIVPVKPRMTVLSKDVITWNTTGDRQFKADRVGFMSQVSPNGRYVVTTISGNGKPLASNFYVSNFKDYRFLQVFYPTGGILAWYDRTVGRERPLPGADDPLYAQTDGVWSPDGKWLVFARAKAKPAYPPDGLIAEYANDPKEVQIQYDLYRIPFNEGRGGTPVPIAGASANGMSNTFPKVSPDGRWIVFVQCRNGQLMRPDGKLYIVPVEGGQARLMHCNTPLMNSWHSFSPNGRWLVFSSKMRSPYTQMYLTHLDEDGNDSPPVLIENSTAANRAVNIPEFVNIPPASEMKLDMPVAFAYQLMDQAVESERKNDFESAAADLKKALEIDPDDARCHNNLADVLFRTGSIDEAIVQYQKTLELKPDSYQVHKDLGRALLIKERFAEAVPQLAQALEREPDSADLHNKLGRALAGAGRNAEAASHFEKAVSIDPGASEYRANLGKAQAGEGRYAEALATWREALRLDATAIPVLNDLAWLLAACPEADVRNGAEAVKLAEQAAGLPGGESPEVLDTLAAAYAEAGRFPEAVATASRALDLATRWNNARFATAERAKIALYASRTPYREAAEHAR
jgi:Flp pilus assembly protein TadD